MPSPTNDARSERPNTFLRSRPRKEQATYTQNATDIFRLQSVLTEPVIREQKKETMLMIEEGYSCGSIIERV
jgi:hypothetical protein